MDLVKYILEETSWLYIKMYQNDFLFFDLWSVVHFWSGFVIYMIFKAFRIRLAFLVLFLLLIVYELAELLFIYLAFNVFHPETIKDQVTDILVGFSGGLLSLWLLKPAKRYWYSQRHLVLSGMMIFAASTYAFPWVGFYHYHYDVEAFNTGGGMNFNTYLTWTVAGLLILQVFYLFRKKKLFLRISCTWMIYFTGLLIFEYITYYIFGIHENSNEVARPLIFGLAHGTRVMHVFYLVCPFLMMVLYGTGVWIAGRVCSVKEEAEVKQEYRGAVVQFWK
jgi:hypothetical protein